MPVLTMSRATVIPLNIALSLRQRVDDIAA